MYKKFWSIGIILVIALLAACGDNSTNKSEENEEELAALEVDFELPETADSNETVELKATVTYGEEFVEDAKEVNFEYWLGDDEDNSTTVESTNNGDGTYTAEVTFEEDGVYSIYAHTTARDLHTMPKKKITVGTGKTSEDNSEKDEEHEHGEHNHGDNNHEEHTD
ncbi:FixH family protein [Virgibacillus sp. W0181]|uniref:FixH family protein n=1 Tax=Virgibacillus sp. W0181 TaxID=3391581 RepID=UPI003F472372